VYGTVIKPEICSVFCGSTTYHHCHFFGQKMAGQIVAVSVVTHAYRCICIENNLFQTKFAKKKYLIAGNIAAGKSTVILALTEKLREKFPGQNFGVCNEPVSDWTHFGKQKVDILDLANKKQINNAHFQSYVLTSKSKKGAFCSKKSKKIKNIHF